MAGEQVTVAELLARRAAEAKAKGEEEGTRPRRRRRSLEEGGTSVAELTGSIPVVDRGERHSTGEFEAVEVEAEPVEVEPVETGAVDATPVEADTVEPEVIETVAEVVEDSEAEAVSYSQESAAFDQVEQENGWATFPEPEAPEPEAPEPEVSEPAVKAEPEPVAAVVPLVEPSTEMHFDFSSEDGESAQVQEEEQAEQRPETAEVPIAEPVVAQPVVAEGPGTESDVDDEEASEDQEEDEDKEKVSVPVIIGESIVGMLVGVGIVKGFEVLWSNFPSSLITAILALVVTFVIVGVVHAVVRTHDKLLMVLAFIVGLVLTFGPLLLVG